MVLLWAGFLSFPPTFSPPRGGFFYLQLLHRLLLRVIKILLRGNSPIRTVPADYMQMDGELAYEEPSCLFRLSPALFVLAPSAKAP
ncbi:MAG: hypothetical protein ACK559_20520 [bacterium]